MRGTIVKKGKRYYVATHHRTAEGKRKQSWHGGYATKAEAERSLRSVLARLDRGEFVTPSKLTMCDFLNDHWLPAKQSTVRASTWNSYRATIQLHVVPHIGSAMLQQLTAADLNSLYAQLLTSGRRTRGTEGLSTATVRYIHRILRRALADAQRWDLVARNVADAADPPRQGHAATEMRTWTAHQLRQFLDHMAEHRLHAAFVVAATTGMRRGELLGLRWQDVDLDAAMLSVRQQLVTLSYDLQFTEPKTPRARRTVDLDAETVRLLRRHRSRQSEERLRCGASYATLDLVFAKEDGTPLRPDNFSVVFQREVRKTGLPPIRLHDLRHTNATLSLQAGVPPKVISDRLGHATVAFTMDVYAHAIPAMQAEAASRVGALIFGGPS